MSAIDKIDKVLPPYWSHGNPVDTVAKFDAATLQVCMETLLELESTNSMIIAGFGTYSYFAHEISSSSAATKLEVDAFKGVQSVEERVARSIIESRRKFEKPIIVVSRLAGKESSAIQLLESAGMPPYPNSQRAARALSKLLEYRRYLDTHLGPEKPTARIASETRKK
jgi:acetyltransferase